VNATIQGIRDTAIATAHAVTWAILNFYVLLLWVTIALIAWRLMLPDEGEEPSIPSALSSSARQS